MEYRVNNLIYAAESEYHNRTGFHNQKHISTRPMSHSENSLCFIAARVSGVSEPGIAMTINCRLASEVASICCSAFVMISSSSVSRYVRMNTFHILPSRKTVSVLFSVFMFISGLHSSQVNIYIQKINRMLLLHSFFYCCAERRYFRASLLGMITPRISLSTTPGIFCLAISFTTA